MGTRADFYIGTGDKAEWLGSIAFDGYRIDESTEKDAGNPNDLADCWAIKSAKTASDFRAAVGRLLAANDDATTPDQGWPWAWEDSKTTDYTYAFVDGASKTFHWGEGADWPNMTAIKNVTLGKRSGTIVLTG